MSWIRKAALQGGNVVCLPELYSSFYFCQSENHDYFDLAEPLHNDSYQAFSDLAKELGLVLIVPFFERRAAVCTTIHVILLIPMIGSWFIRKMHIPDDPSYYEKFYFTPGDIGFKAFDTKVGKIGTLICWDQWYPEGAYYRITRCRCTLLPYCHWLASSRKRAIRNKHSEHGALFSVDMQLQTVFL